MENCANIERGKIQSTEENGYVVASCDRAGIVSPPILAMLKETYTVGDTVYFFLYPDGTGKILCKV